MSDSEYKEWIDFLGDHEDMKQESEIGLDEILTAPPVQDLPLPTFRAYHPPQMLDGQSNEEMDLWFLLAMGWPSDMVKKEE